MFLSFFYNKPKLTAGFSIVRNPLENNCKLNFCCLFTPFGQFPETHEPKSWINLLLRGFYQYAPTVLWVITNLRNLSKKWKVEKTNRIVEDAFWQIPIRRKFCNVPLQLRGSFAKIGTVPISDFHSQRQIWLVAAVITLLPKLALWN